MRTLCYVNHYFGKGVGFEGKSTSGCRERRQEVVARCLQGLRSLPDADVQICGIKGFSLEKIDVDFQGIRDNPQLLIYESLCHMSARLHEYDYFLNVEDDILVNESVLAKVFEFDRESLLNEVLHPNRVEQDATGAKYCVDLRVNGRWTYQRRRYRGLEWRVALNPHSAILLLSSDKFRYALRHIDVTFRGRYLVFAMASAFAYYLSPFCLYRCYDDPWFHTVMHLDRWLGSDGPVSRSTVAAVRRERAKVLLKEFIPPIVLRLLRARRNAAPGGKAGSTS